LHLIDFECNIIANQWVFAMSISVFDLFKVGIGPSSSHTVGLMLAARQLAQGLKQEQLLADCSRVQAELFGFLGATALWHVSGRIDVIAR
jgi:L-serine dehydratase